MVAITTNRGSPAWPSTLMVCRQRDGLNGPSAPIRSVLALDENSAIDAAAEVRSIVVRSRSIKLLLVLSLAVAVLVPVAAVASHQFIDVPNSNIFHADIAWMADNGITKGCNPPTNDMYCPGDNVTRQQMAAFMHRLGVNKVVDAKTAVTADNADKLDGLDSTAFRSVAASASMDLVAVGGGRAVLGSVVGFDAPAAGGGILATATMNFFRDSGPQVGLVWLEIDGSGACNTAFPPPGFPPPGWAIWETVSTPTFDSATALASAPVSAGSHRVDVCYAGLETLDTTDMNGKVLVEWVPVVDDPPGLLEADKTGATIEELLAPYADLLDS